MIFRSLAFIGAVSCLGFAAHAADRRVESRSVDVWNTEVELSNVLPDEPVWIGAHQIIVSTHLSSTEGGRSGDNIELVDTYRRRVTRVASHASLLDYSRQSGILTIGTGSWVLDSAESRAGHFESHDARQLRVRDDGSIEWLYAPARWVTADSRGRYFTKPLGWPEDGYLVHLGDDGKPTGTVPCDPKNVATCSTWVRPGHSETAVPVSLLDVERPFRIEYLHAILLSDTDPVTVSAAQARVAAKRGGLDSYPSTKLLHDDGTVTDIPYPTFLFDFHVPTESFRQYGGANFSYQVPTPAGMLVALTGLHFAELYLYKGERLYKLRGSTLLSNFPYPDLSIYDTRRLELSPTGCQVAVGHQNAVFDMLKLNEKRNLSIITICD